MDCSLPPSSVLEWIAKEVGSKPMFVGSWMARTARQRVSCVLCELGGAQRHWVVLWHFLPQGTFQIPVSPAHEFKDLEMG